MERENMTVEERNKILEAVDILRALGGQNGFSNLQPKIKKMLLGYSNDLKEIVENDVRRTEHHNTKDDIEMTY